MKSPHGFSLIEMAFVLVIVTLLLGGLLVPFTTQIEQKRIAETQKAMEEIKEALLGYAVANGSLPCPASVTNNGQALSSCNGVGYLPYATLGINRADAWGRLYRYAVNPNFTTTFALTSSGTGTCSSPSTPSISVYTRDDSTGAASALACNVVAVIISPGKNGYGGYDTDGNQMAPPGSNTDEYVNAVSSGGGTNPLFYSRTQTGPRASCKDGSTTPCEFDDLVTWLSPNVLFNRMVAAGKLP